MEARIELYKDAWSAEIYYGYQVTGHPGNLTFWRSLVEATGGPALELACGTGRLLLPLARAGTDVVGLDISPFMLAVADRNLAQESPGVQARCRLVESTMAEFSLGQRFGLIYITANSFQMLLTRGEQRSCLQCCAQHLRPDGLLAVDVFNPRLDLLINPAGHEIGPNDFEGPGGVTITNHAHSEYDRANQIVSGSYWYEYDSDEGHVVREYSVTLRYLFRFEMEWMLEACGFEVEALYGDLDKSEFKADSPKMVFVARRKT
jgi:SAM-dependent methyltransferase